MTEDRAQIRLKIYDGSRQRFSERQEVLLRVHNGQTTQSWSLAMCTVYIENLALLNWYIQKPLWSCTIHTYTGQQSRTCS